MAVRVSKADFEEKVLKEALPVLVDFYSDSCVGVQKTGAGVRKRGRRL